MRTFGKTLWFMGVALALTLGACGKATDAPAGISGKGDTYGGKSWVVDMRKAPGFYGSSGEYFWGIVMGEGDKQMNELAAVGQLLQPADAAATQYFQAVVTQTAAAMGMQGVDGAQVITGATFKVVWDQVQELTPGWPTLIFPSAQAAQTGIQLVAGALGVQYQVIVIDASGNYVAAAGQHNLIPMLKETAPARQKYIKDAMQSGDVISYIHPEYTSLKNLMERRASHVAMHYELTLADGRELVHHVDNPNGYGPEYNHKANRHMPFHAFRFAPAGVDAATVQQYGLAARNWAMMTNDISPFAGFFDLRLKTTADLDSFVAPGVKGESIPSLYCSGLAYTNLNLGVNRPQSQAGLGPFYGDYIAQSTGGREGSQPGWEFSDADKRFNADKLSAGAIAQLPPWQVSDQLVFAPYDAVDMLNSWVDNTFRGLPAKLSDVLPAEVIQGVAMQIQAMPLPEEQKAPLVALYQADTPFRMGVIKMVIQTPQFQQQVVGGFSQLEWGEPVAARPAGSDDPTTPMPVATVKNAALWAAAFGLPAEMKDAFIANPCAFIKGVDACDNNKVVVTQDGEMDMMAAIYKSEALSAKVFSDAVKTPMDVVAAMALVGIDNRFVPPRIWLDAAESSFRSWSTPVSGNMKYIGTVTNCEMLSASDGTANADACAGSGGGVDSYKEGGSDSHTYPSFGVRAGGQITHRRVDASNGPKAFGKGTKVTVNFTAARPQDIIFALHVPQHWDSATFENSSVVADTILDAVWNYGDVCTELQRGTPVQTCAPAWGIALKPDTDADGIVDIADPEVAPVLTKLVKIDLIRSAENPNGPCMIANDEQLECELVRQVTVNGRTEVQHSIGLVSRKTSFEGFGGYFVATMINTGLEAGESECDFRRRVLTADGVDVDNDQSALLGCAPEAGSAHFDTWRIEIWNRN